MESCLAHGKASKGVSTVTAAPGTGEAYDKVARLLGLELRPSGGAALEAFAARGDAQRFRFSLPLRQRPNCNFSYAGLKTAVRLAIEAHAPGPPTAANEQARRLTHAHDSFATPLHHILKGTSACSEHTYLLAVHVLDTLRMHVGPQVRADIAASFQRVALGHLEERVGRAAQWARAEHPALRHLVAAGGVAANRLLRAKLQVRAVESCLTSWRAP